MSTSRLMMTFAYGGRQVAVKVSEEVWERGFLRIIDALDPEILRKTLERTVEAFKGDSVMTPAQKEAVHELEILYLIWPHVLIALILTRYLVLWNMRARSNPYHTVLCSSGA